MKKLLKSLILVAMLLLPVLGVSAASNPPSAVTIKSLKASARNKTTLRWKKSKNATAYRVYYKSGKKWIALATVKKTSYTHISSKRAPLVGGKKYTYMVKAYNAKSKKWSKGNKTKSIKFPVIPGNVKVKSATWSAKSKIVRLSWTKATGATAYKIFYRHEGVNGWSYFKTVNAKTFSCKFDLLYDTGYSYEFSVVPYNKTSKKTGKCIKTKSAFIPQDADINIKLPVTDVYFTNDKDLDVFHKKGETFQLKTVASPSQANQDVTYSSSDNKVATVSKTGRITAIGNGTATITATSIEDKRFKATIDVFVDIPSNTKPAPVPVEPAEPEPEEPEPVKVSNISITPDNITLTKAGQTAQLSATVSPANAANQKLIWECDSNIANVDENGLVTANSLNGTCTVTARAIDGSDVIAKCNVTVKIVSEDTITVAGGKADGVEIGDYSGFDISDFSKVTFECSNNNDNLVVRTEYNNQVGYAYCSFKAYKAGTVTITAKYEGKVLKKWHIVVSSTWTEYYDYVAWRKTVESKIWNNSMNIKEKLDAAKNYIQSNFGYRLGESAFSSYNCGYLDCIGASEIMGDFAKDINCQVLYMNGMTGKGYETLTGAVSAADGHVWNNILVNGTWTYYDAQPLHS